MLLSHVWVCAGHEPTPTGRVLAITVEGIKCASGAVSAGRGSNPTDQLSALAAQPVTTCALHACIMPSQESDATCELQSIPRSEFVPCEQGALLVHMHDILQHLQASAGRPQDPQHSQTFQGMDAATGSHSPASSANTQQAATVYSSSLHTDAESLLQIAASCHAAAPAAASKLSRASASLGFPVWSQTVNVSVAPQDHLDAGQKLPTQYDGLEIAGRGWSAGNLRQQLVLVDLFLPEEPAAMLTSINQAANPVDAEDQPRDDAFIAQPPAVAEQAVADGTAEDQGSCTAGWWVWLSRAGMAVVVVSLQLLPLHSYVGTLLC